MADTEGPIGFIDSGIGGCTVLAEVQRQLPNEHLLYLADQAHCPYGSRPPEELRMLTLAAAEWLIGEGAKLIVVACNSASAAALGFLRQALPNTPVVGMVPAVKPAALTTKSGIIGVLATPATIAGGLLRDVVDQHAGHVQVLLQPCAGLADAVEAGAWDSQEMTQLIAAYVAPLVAAGADTLVLGCTHYPLISSQIRAVAGADVALINPAPAIAQQVARILAGHRLARVSQNPPELRFITTGDRGIYAAQLARLNVAPITIQEIAYVVQDCLATWNADWQRI